MNTNRRLREMGGTTLDRERRRLALAAAVAGSDPDYSSVVLLCHFDGSDASTTFTDEKGHALTAQLNAQIDTAQSMFGGASGFFDGINDRVTSPDSADWHFAAGDFTIEAFIRVNSYAQQGNQVIVTHYDSTGNQRSWLFRHSATALEFIYSLDGTATTSVSGSFTFSTGVWYYVAVKRSGTTITLHAAIATDPTTTQVATDSGAIGTGSIHNSTAVLRIGTASSSGIEAFDNDGWIDDLRITKGVARDLSNVPSAAFPNV